MIPTLRKKVLVGLSLVLVATVVILLHAPTSPLAALYPNSELEYAKYAAAGDAQVAQTNQAKDNTVRFVPDSILKHLNESVNSDRVDWTRFAYVQYATDQDYSCNAIMNFARLKSNHSTKADLVLIATRDAIQNFGEEMTTLIRNLGIIVREVASLNFDSQDVTWVEGFTKFYAFTLEEYSRVIYFDSDASILSAIDELFFLPQEVDIAMPLAYDETVHKMKKKFEEYESSEALERAVPTCLRKTEQDKVQLESSIIKDVETVVGRKACSYQSLVYERLPRLNNSELFDRYTFGDHFMVLKPNLGTFEALIEMCKTKTSMEYDMELINRFFSFKNAQTLDHRVLVLPHRTYGALSGTFRARSYELLNTDPTEFECLARAEFNREQEKDSRDTGEHMPRRDDDGVPELKHKQTNEVEQTERVWQAVKVVHFSDYPIPKPWIKVNTYRDYVSNMILCEEEKGDKFKFRGKHRPKVIDDCVASKNWNGLYKTFKEERRRVCGLELIS